MTTDSDEKNPGKTQSRLAKHLHALGLEDHGFSTSELAREMKGIESMKVPQLDLRGKDVALRQPTASVQSRRSPWYGAGIVALAAMLAVIIYVRRDDDGFRVKGAAQAIVYIEKEGVVKTWDKTSSLDEGVRMRVEFKALDDTVAFVGVRNAQGTDLFSPQFVWDNRLQLATGQVAVSSGSIELTGADEDEVLLAVACPRAAAPSDFDEFSDLWNQPVILKQRCSVETLKLR